MSIVCVVPVSRCVPFVSLSMGQLQVAQLLGCPVVPFKISPRVYERSGSGHACFAHALSSFLSIREKKVKVMGHWGRAFDLGALSCPIDLKNYGAVRTAHQKRLAEVVYSPTFSGRSPCVDHLFAGGIKSCLLPVKSTCKK